MHKNLGAFLKVLRQEHGYTQSDVAKHLGTTRQAYAYYEKSDTFPDLEILAALSKFYDVPLDTFLEYYPPNSPTHPVSSVQNNSLASYEKNLYSEFLSFFSQHDNMKKYHHLNNSEKKLLFFFRKLSKHQQSELLLWALFKSSVAPNAELVCEKNNNCT